tara:strand:- start:41 stop:769 length:729 start_codon:yes stop_codon:yes gene_type:complete
MSKGAHDAIDVRIAINELEPNNMKNKVKSETLDLYGLFEDAMFNRGDAIFSGQTEGGDTRFYKRGFSMPSTYYTDTDEPYSTKDQIMQVLANSIRQSPDDTTSTQEVKDFYKLHGQQMPKYKKGGEVSDYAGTEFDEMYKYLLGLQSGKLSPSGDHDTESQIEYLQEALKEKESGFAKQRYKELIGQYEKAGFEQPGSFRDLIHFFEGYAPGQAAKGHPLGNVLRTSDTYLADVYERMLRNK